MPKNKVDRSWSKQEKGDFQRGQRWDTDEALKRAKEGLASLYMKEQAQKQASVEPNLVQDRIDPQFGMRLGAGPSFSGINEAPRERFGAIRKAIVPQAAQPMPVSQDLSNALTQANMTPEQLEQQKNDETMARLKAAAMRAQQGQ